MNDNGISRATPPPMTEARRLAQLLAEAQKEIAKRDAEIRNLKNQVYDAALRNGTAATASHQWTSTS
jgi:hypothetical protein